jgi:hypothetical protein
MDVETIVPGHGPIGGKKELAEMAEYFRLLQGEVKKRLDAGMSQGRAAADIKLGKFDNWIGPERIVMNTVRLYNELRGIGGPNYDIDAPRDRGIQRHPGLADALTGEQETDYRRSGDQEVLNRRLGGQEIRFRKRDQPSSCSLLFTASFFNLSGWIRSQLVPARREHIAAILAN